MPLSQEDNELSPCPAAFFSLFTAPGPCLVSALLHVTSWAMGMFSSGHLLTMFSSGHLLTMFSSGHLQGIFSSCHLRGMLNPQKRRKRRKAVGISRVLGPVCKV